MTASSTTVTALLPALASAIAAMADPVKNKTNPHFKNAYADLNEVLACIEAPLAENGLVLTQAPDVQPSPCLRTRVWHVKSGEWIESAIPLRPEKETPQGLASAITYARRYAIKALFGMSDVDDDGNAASGNGKPAAKAAPARNGKSAPADKPATNDKPAAKAEPFEFVEQAVQAIDAAENKEALDALGPRIKASNFQGEDAARAREAWTRALHELKGA